MKSFILLIVNRLMKTKSVLWITCLLTIALGITTTSVIPLIADQYVYATLLEGNILDDQNQQNDLDIIQDEVNKDLLIGNTTSQQQDQVQRQDDNPDATPSSGNTKADMIPKQQSDIVMQDVQDTALVERVFPMILKRLQPKVTAVEKTIEIPGIFTSGKTFNIGCSDNGVELVAAMFWMKPLSWELEKVHPTWTLKGMSSNGQSQFLVRDWLCTILQVRIFVDQIMQKSRHL